MSTAYGFHMDFQFWVHLTMLGGFQMLQSPRITKLDLERPEMAQNQIFLFHRLDFAASAEPRFEKPQTLDFLDPPTEQATEGR